MTVMGCEVSGMEGLFVDDDGGSFFDHVEEFSGIPVRQAEATGGAGTGDGLRIGGAVNAVSGKGKADPGAANGVIRTGWQDHFRGDIFSLGNRCEDFWVKGVVWVGSNVDYSKVSCGTLGFISSDGAWKAGDDSSCRVIDDEGGGGEEDFNFSGVGEGDGWAEVRNFEGGSC